MSDDDVTAADILQHGGGDFTGERAVRIRAQRLCAQHDRRAAQKPRHVLQIHEWRTHNAQGRRVRREMPGQILDETRVIRARTVHFPVSDD